MKKSFVLYVDYWPQVKLLTVEQRGLLFTAIFAHARGDELPELDPVTQMAYSFIEGQMLRDEAKWEDTCKKRSEAGRKGGMSSAARRKANATVAYQCQPNQADNDNDTDNDNDNDTDTEDDTSAPKAYGDYGWVKLTQEEFRSLSERYNENELQRAIQYLDTSAQSNNNRNGWTDWALMIRRCIDEGWVSGSRATKPKTKGNIITR